MDKAKYDAINRIWSASILKFKPECVFAMDDSNSIYYTCEDIETIAVFLQKQGSVINTFGIPKKYLEKVETSDGFKHWHIRRSSKLALLSCGSGKQVGDFDKFVVQNIISKMY